MADSVLTNRSFGAAMEANCSSLLEDRETTGMNNRSSMNAYLKVLMKNEVYTRKLSLSTSKRVSPNLLL